MRFEGSGLEVLRQDGQPCPVAADLDFAGNDIGVDGSITMPASFQRIDEIDLNREHRRARPRHAGAGWSLPATNPAPEPRRPPDPDRAELAAGRGGRVTGEVVLNGRGPALSADADLSFEGLALRQALRGTRFADETSGTMQGQLDLLGSGRTLDELAGSLRAMSPP